MSRTPAQDRPGRRAGRRRRRRRRCRSDLGVIRPRASPRPSGVHPAWPEASAYRPRLGTTVALGHPDRLAAPARPRHRARGQGLTVRSCDPVWGYSPAGLLAKMRDLGCSRWPTGSHPRPHAPGSAGVASEDAAELVRLLSDVGAHVQRPWLAALRSRVISQNASIPTWFCWAKVTSCRASAWS